MTVNSTDLRSPFALGDTLPAVYREPELLGPQPDTAATFLDLCEAFDAVLAPIFATLDCFPAYLDPETAPEDMLDWLAAWIGLSVAANIPAADKRNRIAVGAQFLGQRGTRSSIVQKVAAAFGVSPEDTEVIESLRVVRRSSAASGEIAEVHAPMLVVRITTDDGQGIDRRRLDAFVDLVKPAHLPHEVDVVARR
jgi:phage tail-like protein